MKGYPMFATAEATKAYADRMWVENPHISPDSWRILEGLTVAKVGLSTFGMDGRANQPEALEKALLSGLNLIDTATTFMASASEVFIGQTLNQLFKKETICREEVVLLSKAGFSTHTATQDLQREDTIPVTEGLSYSLNPEFLFTEYQKSCTRMGVEALDGYLLHAPETLLQHLLQTCPTQEEANQLFYQKLTEAFTCLEELCQQEKLGFYGLASEAIVKEKSTFGFIDLAKVFEAAQTAAQRAWGRRKRPLFRVLQCPLNLLELGALFHVNTTARTFEGLEKTPTLELASRMHLSVLATRPLKAFGPQGEVFHLVDGGLKPNVEAPLKALKAAEAPFKEKGQPLSPLMAELSTQKPTGLMFEHAYNTIFLPLLLQKLEKALQPEAATLVQAFNVVSTALHQTARFHDGERNKPLQNAVRSRLMLPYAALPFAQIALNAMASTPGVTSVLCGLRQPNYITDGKRVLEMGDFADISTLFKQTHS